MRKFLFVLILISLIGIPYASAHPFTEETNPNSSQNAPVGITQVYVIFSEPVEIDFSSLKIYDSNGNQIDNKDTKYYQGESSLIVTTPPLQEGVYTGTSKVLSKVDGHLVDGAFIFAVGDIKLDVGNLETKSTSELLFFPEAGARFPGFVGETIVLGAVIASMLIWGTQNKEIIRKEIEKINVVHHGKFMSITGIGLMLVFASNIIVLAVQTLRLETSAIDAIQTTFGTTWIIRMTITIILLGIWFWMDRKKQIGKFHHIPMLVLSLILIGTSTMVGHGAASEQIAAIALDYVHNFVAAVWIGGIIYFAFALMPTFSRLEKSKMEKMSLVMIPRFSIAFIIAVGIVIISGPTLMWLLESDVGLITESTYGKIIFAKIAIAAIMVGLGGLIQFKIQKPNENKIKSSSVSVHNSLKRSLKIDAVLGIILLGVVALLTNGTLPAGEIQKADALDTSYGFRTIEYSENIRFDIEITPFSSGTNSVFVKVSDFSNNRLADSDELKVKISNPQRGISPIEVPMEMTQEEDGPTEFKGELTFGFSGEWQVEVEAQRTENANESVTLMLLVKPRLSDLKVEIIEFELPEESKPLYPLYDGNNAIWVSDPSAPKIWRFDLETKEFESFSFDGLTSMILTKDNDGKIWFTDTPANQIGFIDPETDQVTKITLPEIQPVISKNTPTFVQSDFDGNIWIAVVNKDVILKYDQINKSFEEIRLPQKESLPFALSIDPDGKVWFTESAVGKIGYIDPKNNNLKEFTPKTPLGAPEALLIDEEGNVWIAEHTGLAIVKFNPIIETFERISVPNQEALPYGMSFDRFGNVWFAQHTVDSIGAYDPDNDELIEIPIPTETSFAQFTTSDNDNNVWFVEQRGNKLGMIKLTEIPGVAQAAEQSQKIDLKYTEIASPLIALGIIATSLFFVKNVKDKRRIDSLIKS
ncbi:CopD family protein [Nitrosopumilus sp. K4]|uniref:virginiamycin B lyase family protein n=1 Tax=Nitrosopumilus sp. K4 TaxID=2795383 RepID=UPI001BA4764F|nr:SMP-30/gluconolactonase/LRE family protein [Nitrosopumilus sp. K4]QUC64722.1 CopD family protein [Nitrosopumilus sp. K4]